MDVSSRTETSETQTPLQNRIVTLRLVPGRRKKKAVRWEDNVVDNEMMNKKKSKKCCIYHKKRNFGDWSDDEDSDCDEEGCSFNQNERSQADPQQPISSD
eukprot:TRINITY_DN3429_c0_g1_i6.p3 TRINITY_DN3429_c0_g1~~TRINITY_DN3429_c0_g1_i6.p3  ORF type:complete len:100 (+),score=17.14 TRINITY_DN3429_c0_g1_i6:122-421(+)